MPDIACPHCGTELRIPESLVGKRLRCKNASCRQAFVAEISDEVTSEKAEVDPSFYGIPSNWPNTNEAQAQNRKSAPNLESISIKTNDRHAAEKISQMRYPNLLNYIKWMKLLTQSMLILGIVIILCATFFGFVNMVKFSETSLEIAIGTVLLFSMTAIISLITYAYYLCLMAGLEFIQVVVDIEENTRITSLHQTHEQQAS